MDSYELNGCGCELDLFSSSKGIKEGHSGGISSELW
jgi:hypothetical protein